ncbi:MAG: tetratricopeptide repeat protein [Pedobacter sp.]|nr:MAG: tetratricopeptide repeat protein [Pedobacter sp.]
MSKNEQTETKAVKKGSFVEENGKSLLFIAGAILLLGAIALYYFASYLPNRAEKASAQMYKAEQYIGVDSLANKAINGDGGYPGLAEIAEEYDNTKSANLANLYLGGIYLRKGEYNKAIESLNKYSSTGSIVADPLALGLLGDAHSELKEYDKAASFYQKAADKASNKFTSPMFLKKLGLVKEALKDYKGAVEAYQKIKNQYADSQEAATIETYIARAELQVK